MLEFGYVGDFTQTEAPCEKVEQPYITYDEFISSGLQHQEQVQCPLYEKRCEYITNQTSSGSVPCELLFNKLRRIIGINKFFLRLVDTTNLN